MSTLIFLISAFLLLYIIIKSDVDPFRNVWYDIASPLNFFMFKEPSGIYPIGTANLWVPKPWNAIKSDNIPCRYEKYNDDKIIESNEDKKLIIYSHGNNEDLSTCIPFQQKIVKDLHMDVISWDYSGYGLNTPSLYERSSDGINDSLMTIYNFCINKLEYKRENIIFWGYSLGTGPSIYITHKLCQMNQPPCGLVLFGAYASIKKVMEDLISPYSKSVSNFILDMFHERWNSSLNIKSVTCPILLMHGQSDKLILPRNSQILHNNNNNSELKTFPNIGHTTFNWKESITCVYLWMEKKKILKNQEEKKQTDGEKNDKAT